MTMPPAPRCTACDHVSTSEEPFFYEWRGRRFSLFRCLRCTHQFVHPPVSREDQSVIYSDQYFSKEGDWVCGVFRSGYSDAGPQLTREARLILDMLPSSSGTLLDIGCAGGVFLNEARNRGFDVQGLELNESMAEYARNTFHLEVRTSRIEDVDADQWSRSFDVVTLLDCLEHIPQPLVTVQKVARWLRPGGVVFIRGPLSNSSVTRLKEGLRRALRVRKRLPGYPLDANSFNKRSLQTLLELSGFERPQWIGESPGFSNVLARRLA